jgi:hypothetical protein
MYVIIAKMDAHQERMTASVNAWWKEMTACQEAMEACLGKTEAMNLLASPEEIESEAEYEEAAVKTFGALKEQYEDWHLAVRRQGQLKRWTQGNSGSQKKLATGCRRMTRHAGVAWCKGHSC